MEKDLARFFDLYVTNNFTQDEFAERVVRMRDEIKTPLNTCHLCDGIGLLDKCLKRAGIYVYANRSEFLEEIFPSVTHFYSCLLNSPNYNPSAGYFIYSKKKNTLTSYDKSGLAKYLVRFDDVLNEVCCIAYDTMKYYIDNTTEGYGYKFLTEELGFTHQDVLSMFG